MDKINAMKFLFPFLLLVAVAGCKKEKAPCAAHYTGDNCTEQIPPAKVFVSKVVVVSFDSLNNGASWDVGGGLDGGPLPDMFFNLRVEGGEELWNSEIRIDCAPGIQQTFTATTPIEVRILSTPTLQLELFDSDVSTQTQIASFTFPVYTSTNNFPSTLELQSGNNHLELHVSYEW